MKIIKNICTKAIIAIMLIYSFNSILNFENYYIPINGYSIFIISILGIPGLIALIGILLI